LFDLYMEAKMIDRAHHFADLAGIKVARTSNVKDPANYYEELICPKLAPGLLHFRRYDGYEQPPPVQVVENLYRGPFPDQQILLRLAVLGIKSIVSLCDEPMAAQAVRQFCQNAGLTHHHLPLSPLEKPALDQINEFLKLMENRSQSPT